MKMNISNTITKAFMRLLPVQVLSLLTAALNTTIDSMITGTYLGTEAMAAIGLFAPIITIIYLCYVIFDGMLIMIGTYIGSGNESGVNDVFNTGMLAAVCYGLVLSCIGFVFSKPVSEIMGGTGNLAFLFTEYVKGYAPGIPFLILSCGLSMMISYNNAIRRSYISIAVMAISNMIMDLIMVVFLKKGVVGIGVATSISYICSVIVLIPSFLVRSNTLHFIVLKPNFAELREMLRLGLKQLAFNLGNTLKTYIVNIAVLNLAGAAAVAVINVQNSLSSVFGAFPCGNASAYSTLSGIYYGEEDRRSFLSLTKLALIVGVSMTTAITLLMAALSGIIPYAYFPNDKIAFNYSRRMLLIFPCLFIFNAVSTVFFNAHHVQKRLGIVNALSFIAQIMQGLMALLLSMLMGLEGIFIAYPLSELMIVILLYIYGTVKAEKGSSGLVKWTVLSSDLGAPDDAVLEHIVNDMDDVINFSERVIDFCTSKGISGKTARIAGLCIEEMAGNVVSYGFTGKHKHTLEIRVAIHNGLVIRLRDNCKEFDPKSRMKQFDPEDPAKNIGIRMISRLTDNITYHNDAGVNTLLIRL